MNTKKLTLSAMLSALAIVLSFIESQFVIVPACPGIKLGLSNTVVMFSLLTVDKKTALSVGILKALFAFATRGLMAGLLSLSGGIFSIVIMIIILSVNKSASTSFLSMAGALSHNLMQFTIVRFIYGGVSFTPYIPLLIVSGVLFGFMNAVLLHFLAPKIYKIGRKK